MKKIIFIICLFCNLNIFSQSLTPQTVAVSGNYFSNGAYSLSWTVGDLATTSLSNNNFVLTQGFQQSFITVTPVVEIYNKKNININLYPNPTKDFLHIDIDTKNQDLDKITIELIDLNGRILETFTSNLPLNPINLEKYTQGFYFLRIFQDDKNILMNTYKVQKLR